MKQLCLHHIPKVKLKFCDVCLRAVKTMNLSPNYKGGPQLPTSPCSLVPKA